MTGTTPVIERMSTLDAEFFFADHGNNYMHLGSVAVFKGPAPSHLELIELFEAKLPLVPRYRQVVWTGPLNLLRPAWVPDDNFDITNHVRHVSVPAPGGDAQLRELASRLFAQPLNLARPLWQEWLIDGLAGGRWAILSKIHHCMVDGVGGNDLMTLVFDTEPDPPRPETPDWPPVPAPSTISLLIDGTCDLVTRPLRQLAAVRRTVGQVWSPAGLLNFGRGLTRSARWLAEPSASFLNGPIGPGRRWTWVTASAAQVKRIRAAHGGTVNDAVLAAITGAFRELLIQRGALTADLVVRSLVPVSVREDGEHGKVTNRVAAVLVNLPVSEPDPGRRAALVRGQMDELKRTTQPLGAEIITLMLGFAAPAWLALGCRAAATAAQPLVQTVVTNVPGPRQPLYVLGRKMTALHPYVPIGDQARLTVAIVSYRDTFTFGLTADPDAVPDLDVFAGAIGRALAELETAGQPGDAGAVHTAEV
jgi:diacylglycerol O-acyltransferase / wax synthase